MAEKLAFRYQASISIWFLKRGASAYEFDIRSVRVALAFWIYTGPDAALA